MSFNQLGSGNSSGKSFWSKREGKAGAIALVGIVLGGAWAINAALPFLIKAMTNFLYGSILALVCAGFLYVIFDPRTRAFVSYYYKTLWKSLVAINPIAILEGYVDDLNDSIRAMGEQIALLKGQLRQLLEEIDKNNREIENNLKMVDIAKQHNEPKVASVKATKAGILKETNVPLQELFIRMQALYKFLLKMQETAKLVLEQLETEVDAKKRQYRALKAGYSAFRSAIKVLNDESDEREMFEQAMELLAEDYGNKIGEIENFMETSEGFLKSVDIQNGVYEADGLKMLAELEKKVDSSLLTMPTDTPMLEMVALPKEEEVAETTFTKTQDDFNKFFNR